MCEIELHIGASLQARLNDPCELSRVHSRRTQLDMFSKGSVHIESRDVNCTKLTQLHDALLVMRVSVTMLIGCRATVRATEVHSSSVRLL